MRKVLVLILALMASPTWAQTQTANDRRLNNSLTIDQIKERVVQDLPLGITRADVDSYFSKSRIEYGFYENQIQFLAMVKNIKGGRLFIDKGAQIVVQLNEAMEVSSIEVRPIFTGP